MSKTPRRIDDSAYLDSTTVVRGPYSLHIGQGALVHPRSTISTDAGAVTIGDGSLVSEHCQIGNIFSSAVPDRSSSNVDLQKSRSGNADDDVAQPTGPTALALPATIDVEGGEMIRLASRVHVAPSVIIEAPCNMEESVQIESNVKISRGCTIGSHSKICAGVTLPPNTVVPAWTVVYGVNGTERRRRLHDNDGQRQEKQRLKGLGAMRAGDLETLKRATAAKAPLTKPETGARVRVR